MTTYSINVGLDSTTRVEAFCLNDAIEVASHLVRDAQRRRRRRGAQPQALAAVIDELIKADAPDWLQGEASEHFYVTRFRAKVKLDPEPDAQPRVIVPKSQR